VHGRWGWWLHVFSITDAATLLLRIHKIT
jgi:hypothetical protein